MESILGQAVGALLAGVFLFACIAVFVLIVRGGFGKNRRW